MATKKITDLVELISAASGDVLPIVDISDDITKKIQVSNFPISTATQTAIDAKQDTLVSGTNIKTLNSESLLGSGNIEITASPAGVAGAIQFSDGSAFASDASNLFWDDTNNRLGVGTNAPTATTHIKGAGNSSATNALYLENSDGSQLLKVTNNGVLSLGLNFPKIAGSNVIGGASGGFNCVYNNGAYFSVAENGVPTMFMDSSFQVGIGTSTPTARTHIKGSGSTSATTALLVQNSAGSNALQVRDDRVIIMVGMPTSSAGLPSGAIWNDSGTIKIV
jgi:hypothetical protein